MAPRPRDDRVPEGPQLPRSVQLLADLSALADRDGTTEAFAERYRALREQHHTKKVLQRLLDAAGL